jgi:hypothetical protein
MINTAEIRALLITDDHGTIDTFASLLRELGVDPQPAIKTHGIPEELGRMKYEALLLDSMQFQRHKQSSTMPAIALRTRMR